MEKAANPKSEHTNYSKISVLSQKTLDSVSSLSQQK